MLVVMVVMVAGVAVLLAMLQVAITVGIVSA